MSNAYSDSETTSKPTQATTSSTGEGASASSTAERSPVATGQSLQFVAGGNIDSSPLVVRSAIDAVTSAVNAALASVGKTSQAQTDTIAALVTGSQQSNDAALSGNNDILQSVMANEMKLAEAVQSGGQTESNKTILTIVYVIVGAIALVASLFLLNRKHA